VHAGHLAELHDALPAHLPKAVETVREQPHKTLSKPARISTSAIVGCRAQIAGRANSWRELYNNFDFSPAGQCERASAVRKGIADVCSTLA
jgi:hypothetical protein